MGKRDRDRMKPTLRNLKKRPALWFSVVGDQIEPRITMPNGDLWLYNEYDLPRWRYYRHVFWHSSAVNRYEFAGWL